MESSPFACGLRGEGLRGESVAQDGDQRAWQCDVGGERVLLYLGPAGAGRRTSKTLSALRRLCGPRRGPTRRMLAQGGSEGKQCEGNFGGHGHDRGGWGPPSGFA